MRQVNGAIWKKKFSSGDMEKIVVNKHKQVNSIVLEIENKIKLRLETDDNKYFW